MNKMESCLFDLRVAPVGRSPQESGKKGGDGTRVLSSRSGHEHTHRRKLHSSGLNLVTGHYQLEAGTGEGTPTGQSCAQQTLGGTVSDINGKGEDGLGWA